MKSLGCDLSMRTMRLDGKIHHDVRRPRQGLTLLLQQVFEFKGDILLIQRCSVVKALMLYISKRRRDSTKC